MIKNIPQLEHALNKFYRATIDKKFEEDSDIMHLLDAYREYFGVDVVYILENINIDNRFIYTHTSASSPEYDIKDAYIQISPEEYDDFVQMYDEDGLSTEDKRASEHERVQSIIHFAAMYGDEISGCVGMIDCHNKRDWSDTDRKYVQKLGKVLSSHITKERLLKLNQAYREAADIANNANEAKTRFLFSMSHDIRTPMNAVIGYTGLAKKYIHDQDKVNSYLDKISHAGHELLALINQVLEMSKIESGKTELTEDPANVIAEAEAMIDVLSINANLSNVTVEIAINNLEHENVITDPECVTQILVNIMSNAIKYTRPGGNVCFTIDEQPSDVPGVSNFHFITKDTGIGMSQDFLAHIFDEFSRENSTTINKIQGSGLGMSIVKRLIDLIGGNINIESEPDKGTTVEVIIPMKISDHAYSDSQKANIADAAKLRGKRVLLVEDNEMNLEIAAEVLRSSGMLVETATDGDIALDMMNDITERQDYRYYDFILMDIQMPRMNGFDATKAIRAIKIPVQYHLPIIAMTANAFEEDRQAAFAAGMDEHIAKPIDIAKLIQVLLKFIK